MSAAGLLTTTDDDLLRRFTESANTHDRVLVPTPAFQPDTGNLAHGNFFNVEARSLLTCLHTLW